MKIRTVGALSFICVAMSITPTWAGPVGVQRNLSPDQQAYEIEQLEAKKEQVGWQMPVPPKGPALVRYVAKREQLQDLINRIQSGQSVSPDELDQALQPTTP